MFVFADTRGDVMAVREDVIAARDRAAYANQNIENRFGVAFNSHEAVCGNAAPGEIHCDSRVVVRGDGSGDHVTPDQNRSDRGRGGGGGGGGGGSTPPPLPSGYGPAQFLTAYDLTGHVTGHPIIAIVDAYDHPAIQSDLDIYSDTYGIPRLPACSGPIAQSSVPCFQKVNQYGQAGAYPQKNAGWALEIALDVEVAHAVCQDCSILLVEASSNSYTNLMAAIDRAVALGAIVISNSWGSSEFAGETTYDSHFNRPGVAFTFSSGDSGYGAQYPAASPYVTAVGGTSLFLNADGSYRQELAWSGAGSGCSAFEAKPAWQLDPLCARRMIADVSAVADPNTGAAVYDSVRYSSKVGWWQVGGTSLAAPIVAAVYALSGNTVGAANSIPYALASASTMHDVVGGSNGFCGASYLCTALSGFDGPTGLGSPKGVAAF